MSLWEIAGARNGIFFHTKCSAKMGRVRSPKMRARDDDFMVGLSPIMLGLSPSCLSIRGSNSPIFGSNLQLRISWQAQYLVMLEGDACCSAHCTGRFMCEEDPSSMSFCMAGAIFGDGGG